MKSRNWIEIKNMSPLELTAKLRDSKDRLFRLKFRHSSTPVKNAIEIRDLRKIIAKINTLMRENEIRSAGQSQSK